MTATHAPKILDTWKRVARTAIQTGIPAFITFAAAVPKLLELAHVYVSPTLYAALVSLAGAVTVAATVLTRIMAIPAINAFLGTVGLAGHSGAFSAADTQTTFVPVITAADAAH